MFPMTITVHTHQQLSAILAAIGPSPQAELPLPIKSDPAAEKPKVTKTEGKSPAAASSQPTAPEPPAAADGKSTEASATTPAAAASSAVPDRKDVSAAIVKLAVKDKPRVIEILAGFGVKAGKELKDEQLADCLAQVNEALGV